MADAEATSRTALAGRPPPPPPPPSIAPPTLAPVPSPEASWPSLRRATFHGSGGTLMGIHVVNVLLTLVTLGVYYPWAKTRIRRYLFGESAFDGDRFAYHGTGKELLLGFLKAFLVFLLPVILLSTFADYWPGLDGNIRDAAAVFIPLVFFNVFTPVAMAGARRYRLSRTSWRGIRFSFRGRARDLILIFLKGSLLAIVTFGFYYPFFLAQRQGFMVSHSYFGNERFE